MFLLTTLWSLKYLSVPLLTPKAKGTWKTVSKWGLHLPSHWFLEWAISYHFRKWVKLGQIFWPEQTWSMPKKLSLYLCRNLSCKKMITVPTVLYWRLSVPPSSLFHEWDDNCAMQFMKIISHMDFYTYKWLLCCINKNSISKNLNLQVVILGE